MAFILPIAFAFWKGYVPHHQGPAAVAVCAGTALLLWCVREFYSAGCGTLAPWDPPKRLVTTGPYRYCRNPMYVAVLGILTGWWLLWGSRALLLYAVVVGTAFHLRVVLAEEPWAAQHFGEAWVEYCGRVRRWI